MAARLLPEVGLDLRVDEAGGAGARAGVAEAAGADIDTGRGELLHDRVVPDVGPVRVQEVDGDNGALLRVVVREVVAVDLRDRAPVRVPDCVKAEEELAGHRPGMLMDSVDAQLVVCLE